MDFQLDAKHEMARNLFKEFAEKEGIELTDEMLDAVAGGVKGRWDVNGHSK